MKVLVTGGCGFIGSNFVRHLLRSRSDWRVHNLDKLTYAGNPENLADLDGDPRYSFQRGDIASVEDVDRALEGCDAVVNFAAESHVDRSIESGAPFVVTNVLGTQVLLERSHARGIGRFVQVSTDEVYGSLGAEGSFTEESPLAPNSPYSASKAGADHLVRAYHATFGLEALVTRCSNNYGPYQFPEKLIPLMITNAFEDRDLPVYGDGLNVRDWIHVEDHAAALLVVLERGAAGTVYNIGGGQQMTNLEVVRAVLEATGKPESLIRFVKDRPGHDRRYSVDFSFLESQLGWRPALRFDRGIRRTVVWYRDHREWWERIKSGEFRHYYERRYG